MTVKRNATAPQGAGRIHTDFEKGFIRAEVVGYDDYVSHGGESGAKDAGRWRLEGKEYLLQEGDVVHFRFNVALFSRFIGSRQVVEKSRAKTPWKQRSASKVFYCMALASAR